jgi:hypothetical protein
MGRVRRWVGFALLGILLYLVLMCAMAPARYFALAVARATHDAVSIDDTSGSFWDGSGNLQQGGRTLGTLHWTIHPLALLRLAAVVDLQLEGADMKVKLSADVTRSRYALRDVDATAAAATIENFYPAVKLFGVSGDVHVSASSLDITRDGIAGNATVNATNAASRMLPVAPLGDYRLVLTGRGKRVLLELATERGAVQLAGNGEWRALDDGMLHMEGTILNATAQGQLENMLNLMGPAQTDGKHHFRFDQRLSRIDTKMLFP